MLLPVQPLVTHRPGLDKHPVHRTQFMQRLLILLLFVVLATPGCAIVVERAGNRLADNLSRAILNQDDPQTVRDGAPAWLLLVDGLIESEPDNMPMLLTGSRLYGAYSSAFVQDPERARRLADKALGYAETALCLQLEALCATLDGPYGDFEAALALTSDRDVEPLYAYAVAWAGWIQTRSSDWAAIADLPKVTALLERVVALDETIDNGGAHVYLGVLASLRPPAVGGEPEKARYHFERARQLAGGRNLMIDVLYAKHYARMVFDQDLHDRLLSGVLEAPVQAPGLTLINTLAKEQARDLLESGKDYF